MKKLCIIFTGLLFVGIVTFFSFTSLSEAASEDPIKIGLFGPMKFTSGKESLAAANMAAEEINRKGGVNVGGVKKKIEPTILGTVTKDLNEQMEIYN